MGKGLEQTISFSWSHLTLHFSASFTIGLNNKSFGFFSSFLIFSHCQEKVKRVYLSRQEDLNVNLALPPVILVKLFNHFFCYTPIPFNLKMGQVTFLFLIPSSRTPFFLLKVLEFWFVLYQIILDAASLCSAF